MYILNRRNNLCLKENKTFGKQNKLRHAKDKVKSSDLDIFFKPNKPLPVRKKPLTLKSSERR